MLQEEVKVQSEIQKVPETAPDLGLEKEAKEVEEVVEVEEVKSEKPQEAPEVSVPKPAPAEPIQAPIKKDELLVDIEGILADDLTDIFLELPDDKKLAFKQKGEEVAQKVREAIQSGKFKIGKALGWIREWLRMIPSVNKYFIDQEAKIKADKLLRYQADQKSRLQNKV